VFHLNRCCQLNQPKLGILEIPLFYILFFKFFETFLDPFSALRLPQVFHVAINLAANSNDNSLSELLTDLYSMLMCFGLYNLQVFKHEKVTGMKAMPEVKKQIARML